MGNNEENIPEQYKELLRKIEAIEKALGLSEIEKITKKMEEESEVIVTEEDLIIAPKPEIVFKPKAYLKLAKHALTYANTSIKKKNWVEVIGLLTGRINHEETPLEQIIVEDYWPVDQGNALTVEIVDQKIFADIFHKKDSKHFIIGWAHSHPSYTPFLSDEDFRTHLRYQTFWNKSIAAVIDPIMISEENYGLGIFRIHEDKESYYELSKEIDGMSTVASYESIKMFMNELFENTKQEDEEEEEEEEESL
jgi:proteasome lid subunit RPN8/RPN11